MAEFEPITTQEQLDSIIGERLKRDRETRAKKYEGWISPEDHQSALDALTRDLDAQKETNAQLTAANRQYEAASVKSRIADEIGLDRRLIGRLTGETEEDIRQDAQALKAILGAAKGPAPLGDPEREIPNQQTAGLKKILAGLKGE
ncbi:MAG: hypothetical protein ACI3U8_02155 [Candidatus Onthomonas sp.]